MAVSAISIAHCEKMVTRNPSIDIAKYLAAVLVIAIHTHPFKNIWPTMDFFFVEILCRFAVPFFAVCTGYYVSVKGKVGRSLIKIAKLYILWSLVYLVVLMYSWHQSGVDISWAYVLGWFNGAICSYSFYHLWYLNAMCWGLMAFGLLLSHVKEKYYIPIAICLWLIQIIWYAYDNIMHILPERLCDYMNLFASPTNGITMMLPFLITGWSIRKYEDMLSRKFIIIGMLVSFICLCIEVGSITAAGIERHSFILFTLPCSFFTFACISMTKLQIGGGKVLSINQFGGLLHTPDYNRDNVEQCLRQPNATFYYHNDSFHIVGAGL